MASTQLGFDTPVGSEKRTYVREMFTAIAPRYDLLNRLLSLNLDRRWRSRTIDRLRWEHAPEGTYLDLCAGTLELAVDLTRRAEFGGRVVGADFVVPMLKLGLAKADAVAAVGADALRLPFPDAQFDGCTVGFGVRNLVDVEAGLREMGRVLRPGATLVVLEFSPKQPWPVRPLFLLYFRQLLPRIGRMISRHDTAYRYLPGSVKDFPDPDAFAAYFRRAGFRDVAYEPLALGIAMIHWGVRR